MPIEKTKKYELEYTYFEAKQGDNSFALTGREGFEILQNSLEGKFIVPEEACLPFSRGVERNSEAEIETVLYGDKRNGVYLNFEGFVELNKPRKISVTETQSVSSSD